MCHHDAQGTRGTWKSNYSFRSSLLDDYPKCSIVGADAVGCMSLRGRLRCCWQQHHDGNTALERLFSHILGKVGFVFTREDLTEIRDMPVAQELQTQTGELLKCLWISEKAAQRTSSCGHAIYCSHYGAVHRRRCGGARETAPPLV